MNTEDIIKYTALTAFIWLPIAIILLYTLKNWIYNNRWRWIYTNKYRKLLDIRSRFKRRQ